MIKDWEFEVDDDAVSLIDQYSNEWKLPKTAVPILAIQKVMIEQDPEFSNQLKTGEQFLLDIADKFESKPPETKEDLHEFAELLRYASQFMTTRLVHAPKFRDELLFL